MPAFFFVEVFHAVFRLDAETESNQRTMNDYRRVV